ncbi:MAG: hypothetical protein U0872_11095 [Planctomycetaceae bacterium]
MRSFLWRFFGSSVLIGLLGASQSFATDDFEREPINYTHAVPENCISRLQHRLAGGDAALEFEPHFGYLRSLLRELNVSTASQTLVFSKTSLQRHRISPQTPRSLYFNDDVYVGFCVGGDVVEISAVDPQLGTVFYILDQKDATAPRISRQTDSCLLCHGSSQTSGIPGHLVRSVFPDASGLPILSAGTYRIDQNSPLERRWGGWYVTGTHGAQQHLGNLIIRGNQVKEPVENSAGQNLTDLSDRFRPDSLLTPHSDIVALMVLEHQTMAHNLLTQASFSSRQALHSEAVLNKELGEPPDHRWNSTTSRIRNAGEQLLKYFLFSGEAKLTEAIQGNTDFAKEFAAQGSRDRHGRSLRDFDLERRLFCYPCSYLLDSPSFEQLPDEMRNYVWNRLAEILSGRDRSPTYAHLSENDRTAIREILAETHPGLPEDWLTQAMPAK